MKALGRKGKLSASILAFVVVAVMVFGLLPQTAGAAETTVADDLTINNWHDPEALDDSTKNVGRIWTDKSVSTDEVTLTNKQGQAKKIEKNADSDFIVGMSALSSTAKILGETTVPLDIVLVLDVSGSMDQTSGGYTEVYQLDTSKSYYVYAGGRYREVSYARGTMGSKSGWHYGSWPNRTFVTPKTSASDTDTSHYQFYSYSTVKKMDTLKSAVNSFIDRAAAENDKLDASKQNRISLVKFAGDETDKIGNDTYKESYFSDAYNYTQIVSGYETYTGSTSSTLKSKVNALEPAGATSADYAMDLTQRLVKQSTDDEASDTAVRKNVKRVVIFFTDGEPNHYSGFDGDVANKAIATAKDIKTNASTNASIYTIGVFSNADAEITGGDGNPDDWSAEAKFNAYMHGMSSNYPDATSYSDLGTRAKDSSGNDTQFYKAATDAAELNNIFTEIEGEIVASVQSPTEVDQGENPNQSGYITLTDQLGDYMQVDDINTLVYANEALTSESEGYSKKVTTEGNKKTVKYTFNHEIPETNHVYPEGNLKDIEITVEKAVGEDQLQTGDLITVKIPATLIPLRYYEIDKDGNMTIDETYPLRLFYDVSLKAAAADKLDNPDEALQAYIEANKTDGGQVNFYSNKYDQIDGIFANEAAEGIGAHSHFVPAQTNDFYYFQNDEVLYTDKDCSIPAKTEIDTSGKTTYYYERDYYELGSDGKAVAKKNVVTIPGNSNLLLSGYAKLNETTGEYYIEKGTPRTTSLSYFEEDKAEGANRTETSPIAIKPIWENEFRGKSITTYLGNNGRLTLDLPGELEISKTVRAADGHTIPESMTEQEFEYTLELTPASGSELRDTYTAQKYTGNQKDGSTFELAPGGTFRLKDGQSVKIYGLEAGTEYKVTETKAEHYTASAVQENAGDAASTGKAGDNFFASGTIQTGDPTSAAFTNTYKADPVTLSGETAIKGEKTLTGRSMKEGESFDFTLRIAEESAGPDLDKIIKIADRGNQASVTGAEEGTAEPFRFGDITFTKEGTYVFDINETVPDSQAAAVTYDTHTTKVTVTVEADTENPGKLKASVVYNNGAVSEATDRAVFENRYDGSTAVEGGTNASINADKTLTGRSMRAGEFQFVLETRPADSSKAQIVQTAGNDENGSIGFGPLSYKTSAEAAGADAVVLKQAVADGYAVKTADDEGREVYTLSYRVYEMDGDGILPDGVSMVTGTFNFTVTVTDNGDGTLTAVTNYEEGNKFGFVNQYGTNSVDVNIKGSKVLDYDPDKALRPDSIEGKFTFTITSDDANAPMPASREATNDAAGNVDFGKITYTLADMNGAQDAEDGARIKVFQYKVTESGSAAGVTNDPAAQSGKTFSITLKDDGNGTLKVEERTPAQGPLFSFTNTYSVEKLSTSITDQITVNKELTGRDLRDGEFSFELLEDKSLIATGSNDADGNVTFGSIEYKEPGNHYYTVREVKGSAGGVTYDDQQYTVYTTVTDNGSGKLEAVHQVIASVTDNGELVPADKNEIAFSNSYKADPVSVAVEALKKLEGKTLEDGQFTFQLKDADGKVVSEAKNDKAGAVTFEDLNFEEAGEYEYTVSEVNDKQDKIRYDDHVYKVKITVTDDGNGALAAEVSDEDIVFTNQYVSGGTGTGTGTGADTGDSSNMTAAVILMAMAAVAGAAVLVRRKIKQ